MKKYFSLLSQNPLFAEIRPDDYPHILSCLNAFTRAYRKQEEILSAGAPAEFLGIVLSGSVQVVSDDVFGNQTIFSILEPADLFAEAFCCTGNLPLPVSVRAASDCLILFLDGSSILTSCPQSCAFHTQLMKNMIQVLAQKNLLLNQKLRFLSRRTTREKLLAYLSSAALRSGSRTFSIPFDRQGLADYLCIDRSAMSAELSKLKKEGLITYRKNQFELPASGNHQLDNFH